MRDFGWTAGFPDRSLGEKEVDLFGYKMQRSSAIAALLEMERKGLNADDMKDYQACGYIAWQYSQEDRDPDVPRQPTRKTVNREVWESVSAVRGTNDALKTIKLASVPTSGASVRAMLAAKK